MATLESPVIVESKKVAPLPGLEVWRNKGNGFKVIDLEFKADPDKRSPEWLVQSQAGMPKAQWLREFGKTWIVYDGKPVYQDYDEDVHLLTGNILVNRRSRLVSGWDGGPNDVNLAWCLGVVNIDRVSVTIIDEYQVDDGDIHSFVEVVNSRLQHEWFKIGGFSLHVADQSVFTKSGVAGSAKVAGRAMADIMRLYGIVPIPGEISIAKRRDSVIELMTSSAGVVDGKMIPKWRLHDRCTLLREAMQGGYAYPKVAGGIGGDYRPVPMKNKFSHIANAMEYLCSRLNVAQMSVPYEGRPLPKVKVI